MCIYDYAFNYERIYIADDFMHHIMALCVCRALKPFIRRDFESCPLRLRLLQEIVAYPHR